MIQKYSLSHTDALKVISPIQAEVEEKCKGAAIVEIDGRNTDE